MGSQKGTTDSEKDIFEENGQWECHWHGVIAWVEDDSTWAKHPKDQGMVQRMRGEPNIGTWVCVKEKEAMALIWLYVEEVMADVVTLPKRMSRFLDGGGLSPPGVIRANCRGLAWGLLLSFGSKWASMC